MGHPIPHDTKLDVSEIALVDLAQRLGRTRWPEDLGGGGALGVPIATMRPLAAFWAEGFDWRRQEAELNALRNRRVMIDGVDLHFIEEIGKGPHPTPLLIGHGWPGSVFELLDLIPRLTDPASHGGSPEDAFTVVAPSLPGHGLSFASGQPLLSIPQIADLLRDLMTKVLGYGRFGVHGHDWGAFIAARLGQTDPAVLTGLHVTLLANPRDPSDTDPNVPAEASYAKQVANWIHNETAYSAMMATRPQTLSYGLTDSPVGLAAWMVEKFLGWSDPRSDFLSGPLRDRMLANATLYWATGAIGTTFWPYHARHRDPWLLSEADPVTAPMGYAEHPAEIVRPPRSLADRYYADIRRWTSMPAGGHFPALEGPDALAAEIRAFFRPLRCQA
jgi:pimeloyl-ACP methyl ester carboxylesterase